VKLYFLALFSLIPYSAEARWATHDDAESEVVYENVRIHVNADGTYSESIESLVKILKESGRDAFTTRRITYNSMSSELKILEAKTINGDKSFPVDLRQIEDKPLASSAKGFDQHNQVLIAFPQVQIDSQIYLKYAVNVKESPIPGFFSTSMIYGADTFEKAGTTLITSEIPLYVSANDPQHVLQIAKESASQGAYAISVKLITPVYKEATDESHIHLNPQALTWVDISSAKDWPSMAIPLIEKYEKILNAPLPALFQKISQVAEKQNNLVDRFNTVTSLLAEQVSYMGDWRPISGLYIPRSLATIAETKLADCKDFAAATTAILRSLHISANIAWIKRGVGASESPNRLPTLSEFNHAIVNVRSKNKTYWIDPTNFSSFAQGIFPDISERKALVLDAQNPVLDFIPSSLPQSSQVVLTKEIFLQEDGQFQVEGSLNLRGVAALAYAGAGLKVSKQTIDYGLIKAMGDENRISHWTVSNYDLTSRIVKDLTFQFHFSEKDLNLKTSAGPAMVLSSGSYIPLLLTKTADRVSDLFLGSPLVVRREIHLAQMARQGMESLDCKIESNWVDASRTVTNLTDNKNGIQVSDRIEIKKALILQSELKTPQFTQLQDQLQKCFNGIAVVYKRAE
jgi:hypothetical protein